MQIQSAILQIISLNSDFQTAVAKKKKKHRKEKKENKFAFAQNRL